MIRLEFKNTKGQTVVCFMDENTHEVYSAKHKLLKGLKHARTPVPYFIIQYNGNKCTKSLNQLVEILKDEILRRSNRKIS